MEKFHNYYLLHVLGPLVSAENKEELMAIVNDIEADWRDRAMRIGALIVREDEDSADKLHYWLQEQNRDYKSKVTIIKSFYQKKGTLVVKIPKKRGRPRKTMSE